MIDNSSVSIELVIDEETFLDRCVKFAFCGNDSANALFLIRVLFELALNYRILCDQLFELKITVTEVNVDA